MHQIIQTVNRIETVEYPAALGGSVKIATLEHLDIESGLLYRFTFWPQDGMTWVEAIQGKKLVPHVAIVGIAQDWIEYSGLVAYSFMIQYSFLTGVNLHFWLRSIPAKLDSEAIMKWSREFVTTNPLQELFEVAFMQAISADPVAV